MSSATVRWIGQGQFASSDSGGHSTVIDSGESPIGGRPMELLLIALASCVAVTVVMMLNKTRENIHHLEIEARGERKADPPRAFTHIHLHFLVRGAGVTEAGLERAIRVAEHKYCPVAAAVRDNAEITTSFELISTEN